MADDLLTVADHIADALDLSGAEVTDLVDQANFLMALPVEYSSNGTVHKYTKETGAPVVGFRAENAGREFDHGSDAPVTVELKILDFSWAIDKAVADAYRKGRDVAISRSGFRHLKAAMFELEKQYFGGTATNAAGFVGFNQASTLNAIGADMFINAGGTTAATASSVYLVRMGADDVSSVMIEDSPLSLGETVVQNMRDATDKHFPAYYTPGSSWQAMQIGGKYSVARIGNITEDADKGLTDDLVFDALERFPGAAPSAIVMSRRSRGQLRASRTATNTTGAPAPIPTEVGGVPVMISEGISNTEALVS